MEWVCFLALNCIPYILVNFTEVFELQYFILFGNIIVIVCLRHMKTVYVREIYFSWCVCFTEQTVVFFRLPISMTCS